MAEHEELKILLVEDSPIFAHLVNMMIAHQTLRKATVVHVERLETALAELDRVRFDVVLLDLCLPDSDGLGTLRSLTHKVADLPIVVLTGTSDDKLAAGSDS